MFPAMLILTNLADRFGKALSRRQDETVIAPRFDFSDARDAYEHHATPTEDMRRTRFQFRKRL